MALTGKHPQWVPVMREYCYAGKCQRQLCRNSERESKISALRKIPPMAVCDLLALRATGSFRAREQKRAKHHKDALLFFGAPAENRTPDTLIKSQVLYQLSYRGVSTYRSYRNMIPQQKHFVNTFFNKFQLNFNFYLK